MSDTQVVNIGKQYSRFPAGRYVSGGPASGEHFRTKVLAPLLRNSNERIRIELDDAMGYGSSFLEEAFGGLVRLGFDAQELLVRFEFVTDDLSLKDEIEAYIIEAKSKGA